jgi:hypothetical protein
MGWRAGRLPASHGHASGLQACLRGSGRFLPPPSGSRDTHETAASERYSERSRVRSRQLLLVHRQPDVCCRAHADDVVARDVPLALAGLAGLEMAGG